MEQMAQFPIESRDFGTTVVAKEEQFFQGLLFAIEKGYTDLAELLINEVGEIDCATPLFLALQYGQHRVFDMLFEKGGTINANYINWAQKDGDTLLCKAARLGQFKVVKTLLQNEAIDVNLANDRGSTPLFIAVLNGHEKVVELLLKKEGIKNNQADKKVVIVIVIVIGSFAWT